jgi:hypothetical protein
MSTFTHHQPNEPVRVAGHGICVWRVRVHYLYAEDARAHVTEALPGELICRLRVHLPTLAETAPGKRVWG